MNIWTQLAKNVQSNVLVSKEACRVDILEDLHEVRESGIEHGQLRRSQGVCFRPVWLPTKLCSNVLESGEVASIRNIEAVRSEECMRRTRSPRARAFAKACQPRRYDFRTDVIAHLN